MEYPRDAVRNLTLRTRPARPTSTFSTQESTDGDDCLGVVGIGKNRHRRAREHLINTSRPGELQPTSTATPRAGLNRRTRDAHISGRDAKLARRVHHGARVHRRVKRAPLGKRGRLDNQSPPAWRADSGLDAPEGERWVVRVTRTVVASCTAASSALQVQRQLQATWAEGSTERLRDRARALPEDVPVVRQARSPQP